MRSRSLAAVIAGVLLGSGPVATAHAQPAAAGEAGKTLVVLGDSFTTNGSWVAALAARANGDSELSCDHLPTSWPTRLAQQSGLEQTGDYVDASCEGGSLNTAPGFSVVHETQKAAAAKAFGPRTTVVAIQLGMNDAWGEYARARAGTNPQTVAGVDLLQCVLEPTGCGPEAVAQGRVNDPEEVTGSAYAARIASVIDYLRYYAPNARIVLVGYPEIHTPGTESVCIGMLGVTLTQSRAAAYTRYLDHLDAAQRDAARSLGVEFFDARAETAGHGTCSADPWVNGIADPRTEATGIPFHPTARADDAVARGLRPLLDH
ncbi:SGNH/GDSL hydrolase family protein [Nocardia jejuensis]|uniref:SGNH/GDSL hydrolase family protein n=1 Tax=Nocardia jejuensis TaxID=328049 RepID=UPI000AD6D2D6|nr:SGNH/GDSL hydrolase family protein [Nocardia jejuensis]